jgi:hypothetical protein
VFVAIYAVSLGACSSSTPLEQLEATRAEYKANLNSFFVRETPLEVEPAPTVEGEGEADEPVAGSEDAADAAEGEGEMAMAEPEVRLDAMLDVIVQHDSRNPLDGITLDITMVDANQQELASWRRWVDTAGLPKANQRPVSLVLEDVDYEEGYGFFVEIRAFVAESERGEYREYDGL